MAAWPDQSDGSPFAKSQFRYFDFAFWQIDAADNAFAILTASLH